MMGVRRAATIGFVVVLLTCAALGQGGAAERAAVIIADLQCSGDVLVTRAGGEEVAAYVGLQLFPKDSISATAPAVVTLFDDGSGTTSQDVNPGTPFVLGAAKAETRTLVSGLTSSISDLFGSAEQARKRDQEVGAVQAGAVIARLAVAADVRAKDLGETRGTAGARTNSRLSPNSVTPRTAAPGGSGPQDAPGTSEARPEAQAVPPPAPPPGPALNTQQRPVAPPPPPMAPADMSSEGTASAPSSVGKLEDSRDDGRARQSVPDTSEDLGLDEDPRKESADKAQVGVIPQEAKKSTRNAGPLIAQLEHLRLTNPLARAQVIAMPEGVPLLAGQPVRGVATLTSGGAAVTELNQTLAPGAKLQLHAELSGKAWDTELVIATDAAWNDVKARANELLAAQLPNKQLLVANLFEARGYVLIAYATRLQVARQMQRDGRRDSLARSLWTALGQQALQLGDWSTASEMAARARKK